MTKDRELDTRSAGTGLIREAVTLGLALLVVDIVVKVAFGALSPKGGPFLTEGQNDEVLQWVRPVVPLLMSLVWHQGISDRWPPRVHLFATAALGVGVGGAVFNALYVGANNSIDLVVGSMPVPNSLAEGCTLIGTLLLLLTPMRKQATGRNRSSRRGR